MKAFSVEPGHGMVRGAIAPQTLRIREAAGFFSRARGLLGQPPPARGCGLLLRGVRAVHGFGMRHAIDLVFLDGDGVIVRCARLAPRTIAGCAAATQVVEMREGEIGRLGLQLGMRPHLLPTTEIFLCGDGNEGSGMGDAVHVAMATATVGPRPAAFAQRSRCAHLRVLRGHVLRRHVPRGHALRRHVLRRHVLRLRVFLRRLLLGLLLSGACLAASLSCVAVSISRAHAQPAPPTSLTPHVPRIDTQLLRRLEGEAEALYRDAAPHAADAELVRLYESLATAAPKRAVHAWLRIGNIHQRAGAVGAAIDAYRLALDATLDADPDSKLDESSAEEDESRRKSLLNLASLALEQARQALARLGPLPAAAAHRAELELLDRRHGHVRPRAGRPPAVEGAGVGDETLLHEARPREAPYVVERYTASARRNAVKEARGSLHTNPADELPARPVPKSRSRPAREKLPDVEYLLGDPRRFKGQADDRVDRAADHAVDGGSGRGGAHATKRRASKRSGDGAGESR